MSNQTRTQEQPKQNDNLHLSKKEMFDTGLVKQEESFKK